MKNKKFVPIVTALLLLLQYFSPLLAFVNAEPPERDNTCPTDGAAVKAEWNDDEDIWEYEFTDDSATVGGDDETVEWSPEEGFDINAVCIKIGGPGGGSTHNPALDPDPEEWTTPNYGISHIVIWTSDTETDVEPTPVANLKLTSMCWEDDDTHRFRVRNENAFGVEYQASRPVQWTPMGTADPGDTFFTVEGTKGEATTTKIRWMNENDEWKETVKAANQNYCPEYNPDENEGTLYIKKYECSQGSVINATSFSTGTETFTENDIRPNASGQVNGNEFVNLNENSFPGCVEGASYEFAVDQHPEDESGAGAPTGTVVPQGVLTTNADGNADETYDTTDGRLEVRELVDPSRILGFACYRDGQGHGDISNFGEYALYNDQDSAYCIAFNKPAPYEPNECTEGPTWVERYTDFVQGKRKDGSNVLVGRSNPDNILGPADDQFTSLGFGGTITGVFEYPVMNVEDSMDISVHELTNGAYHNETAKVEASLDGLTWFVLGTASNQTDTTGDPSGQGGFGVSLFDLETVGLDAARYIRVTDTTDPNQGGVENTADGYDLDAIDATYTKCEELPDLSTVQVCKYDTQQNPLYGWKVMLLGEKVETVPVYPDDTPGGKTPTSSSNLPEDDYVLLASGTYEYRGNTGLLSDPGYSERLESDGYTSPFEPWINIMDLGIPGALGVSVNDTPTDWGYFSPSHEYANGYLNYSGPFSFTSIDDNTSDNVGNMSVDIYKGYAGMTGEDGCVTFEDVPYGEYTTDEILMPDWSNVSGKGESVEVDEESETFSLVNYRQPDPATLTAYKVVCTDEKYLPNNTQGAVDENTAQNWVDQSEGECWLARDWDFQWAPIGTGSFGAFQTDTSSLGAPWTTFSAYTPVELEGNVEVREAFPNDDYVPFSNAGNVSAELWCTGDQANYDNWEWVQNVQPETDYHCVAFNAYRSASIDGYKLEDLNGDGELTRQDPRLSGWEINLWTGDENGPISIIDTAVTDENGYYSFENLKPGIYWLNEVQQDGWQQTAGDEVQGPIKLEPGDESNGNNFGNFELGQIMGYKFEDKNGNGEWDDGEPGVKNWKIRLYKDGEYQSTKWTDKDGKYMFDKLMAGEYEVREGYRQGWGNSTPTSCEVDILSGSEEQCTFGNFKYSRIVGAKYEDSNVNGQLDLFQEFGLNGWEITLWEDTNDNSEYDEGIDQLVDTEYTGGWFFVELGIYTFNQLEPGRYFLMETMQEGWMQTDPGDPGYYTLEIESGDQIRWTQFGNYELGRILGEKYNDVNVNGSDDKEPRLADWGMRLYDSEWTMLQEMDTNESGEYEFNNLPVGTYYICEESGAETWWQTEPEAPEGVENASPYAEQEASRCHEVVIYMSNQEIDGMHFGNTQGGEIRGLKWNDDSGNGERDLGEPVLQGWTIKLWDEGEEVGDQPGNVIAESITDENGEYEFLGLVPGTYYVSEVQVEPWTQTYPVDPGYHRVVVTGEYDENSYDFGNNVTPDIVVTKDDGQELTEPGEELVYTVTVLNDGDETAYDVLVTDELPDNVTFQSSDPTGTFDNIDNEVTWSITSLEPGEDWTADVTVLVDEEAEDQDLVTNRVLATELCNQEQLVPTTQVELEPIVINYCEDDPTPENNEDTDVNTVVVGDVEGIDTGPTTSGGSVLGATDELADTGKSMYLPLIIGLTIISLMGVLNLRKPEPKELRKS